MVLVHSNTTNTVQLDGISRGNPIDVFKGGLSFFPVKHAVWCRSLVRTVKKKFNPLGDPASFDPERSLYVCVHVQFYESFTVTQDTGERR